MLTPIKNQGDEHLSVCLISCVTDCRIVDWIGICTAVDMLIGTKNNSGKPFIAPINYYSFLQTTS